MNRKSLAGHVVLWPVATQYFLGLTVPSSRCKTLKSVGDTLLYLVKNLIKSHWIRISRECIVEIKAFRLSSDYAG